MPVLAQFDLVKPKYPKEDPRMDGFYRSAPHVNRLAEGQYGFLWREKDDEPELADKLFGPGYLYTISKWESVQSLHDFLYRSPHIAFIKAGHTWFDRIAAPHIVLWWVERDHVPTLVEAHRRLLHLRNHGPTMEAFDLENAFYPHDITQFTAGF